MCSWDGDPVEDACPLLVKFKDTNARFGIPRRNLVYGRQKNVSVPSGTDVGLLHEREAVHMLS